MLERILVNAAGFVNRIMRQFLGSFFEHGKSGPDETFEIFGIAQFRAMEGFIESRTYSAGAPGPKRIGGKPRQAFDENLGLMLSGRHFENSPQRHEGTKKKLRVFVPSW